MCDAATPDGATRKAARSSRLAGQPSAGAVVTVKLTFGGSYYRWVSFEERSDADDVELASVRAELDGLVRARALGGWTDSDEERYRVLCERERELLRDDGTGDDEDR